MANESTTKKIRTLLGVTTSVLLNGRSGRQIRDKGESYERPDERLHRDVIRDAPSYARICKAALARRDVLQTAVATHRFSSCWVARPRQPTLPTIWSVQESVLGGFRTCSARRPVEGWSPLKTVSSSPTRSITRSTGCKPAIPISHRPTCKMC